MFLSIVLRHHAIVKHAGGVGETDILSVHTPRAQENVVVHPVVGIRAGSGAIDADHLIKAADHRRPGIDDPVGMLEIRIKHGAVLRHHAAILGGS